VIVMNRSGDPQRVDARTATAAHMQGRWQMAPLVEGPERWPSEGLTNRRLGDLCMQE
jgi:hypothetical protein